MCTRRLMTRLCQLCSAWRIIKNVTRLQRAQNAAARVVVWGSSLQAEINKLCWLT